eukprot:3139103-Karenia_brevis.AAC.1
MSNLGSTQPVLASTWPPRITLKNQRSLVFFQQVQIAPTGANVPKDGPKYLQLAITEALWH